MAATDRQGVGLAATGCQGEGVAATGRQVVRLAATGCQGEGVAATGCQGEEVAATGCQGEEVAATGCQGEGLVATGCLGEEVAATGCQGEEAAATGCQGEGSVATGCQGEGSVAATGCQGEGLAVTGCLGEVMAATGCQGESEDIEWSEERSTRADFRVAICPLAHERRLKKSCFGPEYSSDNAGDGPEEKNGPKLAFPSPRDLALDAGVGGGTDRPPIVGGGGDGRARWRRELDVLGDADAEEQWRRFRAGELNFGTGGGGCKPLKVGGGSAGGTGGRPVLGAGGGCGEGKPLIAGGGGDDRAGRRPESVVGKSGGVGRPPTYGGGGYDGTGGRLVLHDGGGGGVGRPPTYGGGAGGQGGLGIGGGGGAERTNEYDSGFSAKEVLWDVVTLRKLLVTHDWTFAVYAACKKWEKTMAKEQLEILASAIALAVEECEGWLDGSVTYCGCQLHILWLNDGVTPPPERGPNRWRCHACAKTKNPSIYNATFRASPGGARTAQSLLDMMNSILTDDESDVSSLASDDVSTDIRVVDASGEGELGRPGIGARGGGGAGEPPMIDGRGDGGAEGLPVLGVGGGGGVGKPPVVGGRGDGGTVGLPALGVGGGFIAQVSLRGMLHCKPEIVGDHPFSGDYTLIQPCNLNNDFIQ